MATPSTSKPSAVAAAAGTAAPLGGVAVAVAVTQQQQPSPYHLLMSEDAKKANAGHRRLDPKLQRDYLSKRQRAFQEAGMSSPSNNYSAGASADSNNAATTSMKQHSAPIAKPSDASSSTTGDEVLWSGASPLERAMIGCCTTGVEQEHRKLVATNELEHQDTDAVMGALLAGSQPIERFLQVITLHGHDVASRSLALAILERTQELDDRLYHEYQVSCAEMKALNELTSSSSSSSSTAASKTSTVAAASEAPIKTSEGNCTTTEEPPRKKARISDNGEVDDGLDSVSSGPPLPPPAASPSATIKPPPPRRILHFLAAGGLRLLGRWLVEASRPILAEPPSSLSQQQATTTTPALGRVSRQRVSVASSSSSSSTTTTQQQQQQEEQLPSPTGPLLLPLLQFLQRIPFDKQLITQSKVHKDIRNLSKQLDACVASAAKQQQQQQQPSDQFLSTLTHPIAGGLPIVQVQQVVNQVKGVWAEQHAKQNKEDAALTSRRNRTSVDAVQKLLQERLQQLEAPEKPAWLIAAQQSSSNHHKKKANHKTAGGGGGAAGSTSTINKRSTEQMARRERENERAALMKQDLEKAQRERAELLRKLRHMQTKKAAEEAAAAKEASHSKRRVRWKDGLGPASKLKKRELLEQVKYYVKDQDRLAAMEEEEEENDEEESSTGAATTVAAAAAAAVVTTADEDDHLEDEEVAPEDNDGAPFA